MRPILSRSLAAASAAVFIALMPASGAVADNMQMGDAESEGTQIVAAGAADTQLPEKNLNSVPLDGFSMQMRNAPESALVRQLTKARPNEDLVICIAGCFSDRDRVVYAQPIDRKAHAMAAAATAGEQSANGASDGTGGSVTQSLRGSQ